MSQDSSLTLKQEQVKAVAEQGQKPLQEQVHDLEQTEAKPEQVQAPEQKQEQPQAPDLEKTPEPEHALPAEQATTQPVAQLAGPALPPPPVPPVKPNYDEEEDDNDAQGKPLSLLGHLNELRLRLTRIVIVIILGFVACYGIAEILYNLLALPLTVQLPKGSTLIYTSPAGAFFTYMKVALVASFFLTSPYSFYQIWAFIAPGLYKEEKSAVIPLAFFSAFFFISGALFCYLLVFPIAFKFFMGFATELIVPMISVEEYLGFALKLLIAFGLVFEMPLFAYFLSKFGLLTPEFMRKNRKYAVLLIFVVAAILTPPDVFSQTLMAVPMLLLYEVSVFVSAAARKTPKDEEEEAESKDEPKPQEG